MEERVIKIGDIVEVMSTDKAVRIDQQRGKVAFKSLQIGDRFEVVSIDTAGRLYPHAEMPIYIKPEHCDLICCTKYDVPNSFSIRDIYQLGLDYKFVGLVMVFSDLLEEIMQGTTPLYIEEWEDIWRSPTLLAHVKVLEKTKYLKRVHQFKPFEIKLPMETLDDMLHLYHRLNMGDKHFTEEPSAPSKYPKPTQNMSRKIFDKVADMMKVIEENGALDR